MQTQSSFNIKNY